MFDSWHCIESDYVLLVKETDKIINIILNNSKTIESDLNKYLKLIARFDKDTAETLAYKLSVQNLNGVQKVEIINKYINVLKQQVLVDIQEHKDY